MQKFTVNINKGKTTYTETIIEYDKFARVANESDPTECSAGDMYTKVWENGNVWHFKKQLIISLLGLMAGAMIEVNVITAPFAIALIYFCVRQGGAWKSHVEYILDSDAQKRVDAIENAYEGLNTSQSVFPDAGKMTIKNFEANTNIFGWIDPTDKDEIFMLPDVCLVNVKQGGFAAIAYSRMYAHYIDMKPDIVLDPLDSRVVKQTYRWTNKDGSPDRRRRADENYRMYEVIKGFPLISDDPGFDDDKADANFSAGLITSSPGIGEKFANDLKKIFGNKPVKTSPKPKSKPVTTKPNKPKGKVTLDDFDTNKSTSDGDDFMTLSESVFISASTMGNADGSFDESEMGDVTNNNSIYLQHMQQIDFDAFKEKIDTGKCTKELAISIVKKQTNKVQLDTMAIVWHVLVSDGVMSDEEKEVMAELLTEFDMDIKDVNARYEQIVN